MKSSSPIGKPSGPAMLTTGAEYFQELGHEALMSPTSMTMPRLTRPAPGGTTVAIDVEDSHTVDSATVPPNVACVILFSVPNFSPMMRMGVPLCMYEPEYVISWKTGSGRKVKFELFALI
jgi:hypothetical protein